jgi:hypothetical protein
MLSTLRKLATVGIAALTLRMALDWDSGAEVKSLVVQIDGSEP